MGKPLKPVKEAIFQFGAFELRTETGELFKHGIRIRLQMKPLQILEALLAKPGQLVTRDELCKDLWPAGTFVDFESGLNTATNRLRAALKDAADSPRYIETLPRLGYRFICPVVKLEARETKGEESDVDPDTRHVLEMANAPAVSPGPLLPVAAETMREPRLTGRIWLRTLYRATPAVTFALFVALIFAYIQLNAAVSQQSPNFHQLNFRTGLVEAARFLNGANQVVYTEVEGVLDRRTMLVSLDGSNSRTLPGANGKLTSVSGAGEVAMILSASRLLRVSENGQPVRMLDEKLRCADWLPNGREVALVSIHKTESWVEFPAGHVVYRSSASINNLRVSPKGDEVAFLEHPERDDDEGYPIMVNRRGDSRVLTKLWSSADGLAWAPNGQEVWFTAAKIGMSRALYAVSMSGMLRRISNTPSSMRLFDISRTGRVLIGLDDVHTAMAARLADASAEEDISNFDGSHVDDISSDGRLILFTEAGDAGGNRYSAYTFDRQSGKAIRFATGRGFALSPDKSAAITIDPRDRSYFTLTYLGSRKSQRIQGAGFEYQWVKFHPDGTRVLAGGAYPGKPFQICMQSLEGGNPAPLKNATYMDSVQISPDGERIAGWAGDRAIIVDIASGLTHAVPLNGNGAPIAWSHDGHDLFLLLVDQFPPRVVKADWRTGSVQTWETLAASRTSEFAGLSSAVAAPSANAYAYSTNYYFSRLYLVDGWS